MEFLTKNQFKIAAIAVSLLIICIIVILVLQNKNNSNSDLGYYIVNFDGVEGTSISDQIVLKGEKINEPKEPIKDGYIFLGWYINDEKYNFDNRINSNITIEAKWKKDGVEEVEKEEESSNNDGSENKKPTTENNNNNNNSNNNTNNNNGGNTNNNTTNNNNNGGSTNKPTTSDKVNVTSVVLNKSSLTLDIGKSDTLVATINPSNATDKSVVWSSSNTGVVTVNNGVVYAVSAGSATITATVGGKSASCVVTVNKKITYSYEWQRIDSSSVGEYYLYIVSSEGKKVSGKVNIMYSNGKSKEHDVPASGIKLVKSAVSSVEIISAN